MIAGIIIGAAAMLFFFKFTMSRSGCGELKMCKQHCPYYTEVEIKSRQNDNVGEDDE